MSRRVLVVGATGFLGSSVLRRSGRDHEVLGACRHPRGGDARFDFRTDDVEEILRVFPAEIVVFAGSVERPAGNGVADWYRAAIDRFLAPLAELRLVYISSDAIFDGSRGQYREADPPSPADGYGRNLHLFEDRVRAACRDHCIVRSSYLYGFGAHGLDRRLAETRKLLLAGASPQYAVDLFKSPMEIGEVAETVLALAIGSATGTVHVSGPRSSVFDFHHDAMVALGLPADRLRPMTLPEGSTIPRDTSLDPARMTMLTGIVPRSVKAALGQRHATEVRL